MNLHRALGAGLVVSVVAIASCTARRYECDATAVRCGTFCDTWCDAWGCFTRCYDRCWSECVDLAEPAPPAAASPICAPCRENADCAGGAKCVTTSDGDGGASPSFCAPPCERDGDCPIGTVCRSVGRSALCLPPSGRCP